MINRLLVILALAVQPAVGAAQHAAPEIPAPRREPGLTLTVAGYLLPSPRGALMVPLPLLERLASDGALLAIDTAPVVGRVVLQVRFGFADVAEFQRWYADERTVRLLDDLRAITFGGSFETFVSYRRRPPA